MVASVVRILLLLLAGGLLVCAADPPPSKPSPAKSRKKKIPKETTEVTGGVVGGILGGGPPPPPPPPEVLAPPKPANPGRVRIDGQRQQVYLGVGQQWDWYYSDSPEEALANLNLELLNAPGNVEFRGAFLALSRWCDSKYGGNPNRNEAFCVSRIDHLLWMIENHPDWDGFAISPDFSLCRIDRSQNGDYERVKIAWLRQAQAVSGDASRRAAVLHNAGLFFAVREPELAEQFLLQAIDAEPKELLYPERLGLIYAYSLLPVAKVERFGVSDSPERMLFAQKARRTLEQSNSWAMLASAAYVVGRPFLYEPISLQEGTPRSAREQEAQEFIQLSHSYRQRAITLQPSAEPRLLPSQSSPKFPPHSK